jgi:hypothetical protein
MKTGSKAGQQPRLCFGGSTCNGSILGTVPNGVSLGYCSQILNGRSVLDNTDTCTSV